MPNNESDYMKHCDLCQQYRDCHYCVSGIYGTWELCEECYHRYRVYYNTLSDRAKETIIKDHILNVIKRIK